MNRRQIFKLYLSLIYIGFGSILSQIILIREFLVTFYGNELSLGIIFAAWLIWIGIGSAFGSRIIKQRYYKSRHFFILLIAAPFITVLQIFAVKFTRPFFQIVPGEFLSITQLLGSTIIILSLGCITWGMLFTLGAKSLGIENKKIWIGVNKAYVLELIGSVIGGLLFSLFFASVLSAFQIIFFIFLIACVLVWQLLSYQKIKHVIIFSLAIAGLYAFLLNPIRSIEQKINAFEWSLINDKLTFIRSIDTKYQNLSLLRIENQYTIYTDGRPVYNIPNTYDAEVFIHSIMIHRTDAYHVLIIGGGFNGLIKEVLKYPVHEIEYVEMDPDLLPFTEPVLDKSDRENLHNARVKILSGDGRDYLLQTDQKYDVIILDIGEPSTANLNRFFTLEFYQQCVSRLTPDGIFVFPFPSSSEYIANELRDLDASLYHTLKQAFAKILIIPGDRSIAVASNSRQPFVLESDLLAYRFRESKISCNYFSEYMYKDLMLPERIQFITKTLEEVQNYRLNSDNNPVTYYFDLLLWNRFMRGDNQFFQSITSPKIFIAVGICIAAITILLTLRRKQNVQNKKTFLAIIIACSGIAGMALNLLLVLNFQEAFGSVYEMVGVVIAANMLGMALGASAAGLSMKKYQSKTLLFILLAGLIVLIIFIPVLLKVLLIIRIIWFTLLAVMLNGGLVGMLFGIVNRLYLERSKNIGSIYSIDVMGSSIGALTTCSILLPILGIYQMSYLLVLIILPAVIAAIKFKEAS